MRVFSLILLLTVCVFPHVASSKGLADAMLEDGIIVGRACVCEPALANGDLGRQFGGSYIQWYLDRGQFTRAELDRASHFLFLGISAGAERQTKDGKAGCKEVMQQFRVMAKKLNLSTP